MEKWEYKVIDYGKSYGGNEIEFKDIEKVLNTLGIDGWELVNCKGDSAYGVIFLKRRKEG